MKTIPLFFILLMGALFGLSPETTIVVYNSSMPESRFIAKRYISARQIPESQLIGLELPQTDDISISDYEELLAMPLKSVLDERQLWDRSATGTLRSARFELITTIYGVPFKIKHSTIPAGVDKEGNPTPERKRTYAEADGASVDSELTLLGTHTPYRKQSSLRNSYYKSDKGYTHRAFPQLFLTGRIDGPSPEICIKMIHDAIEVEATGLFGMCYLDKYLKGGGYQIGDDWLDRIFEQNKSFGIPTVMENTSDVYLTNYPLLDAALYYGWYSHHASGAFKNAELTFKKGSIITHLHSFSAEHLRSVNTRWTGPILSKGVAATLGSVHEPFLQLSTNFDHFHKQLLSGKTLAESAWSGTPSLSWHNVVIGDPLYRPFLNQRASEEDQSFGQYRKIAPITTNTKFKRLVSITEKANSVLLHEATGLLYQSLKAHKKCVPHFQRAAELTKDMDTKARNILHQIAYKRQVGDPDTALLLVKAHQGEFADLPVGLTFTALKNILAPPPPPKVTQ